MAAKATKAVVEKKVVIIARTPGGNWARILYGTLVAHDAAAGTATVKDARQCLYYSKETGGEIGLSAIGPQAGSRVSPKSVGNTEVAGVGIVSECAPAAITAWEDFK
jgi:hypothetical protein